MEVRPGPAEASSSRHTLQLPYVSVPAAPKVSQIDAGELDEGLVHMLAERLERAVGNFRIASDFDFKPEIALLLKLVIFRLSFGGSGSNDASPGFRLVNLRLVRGKRADKVPRHLLLLYLLLHPPIFPSYILHRLRSHALSRQWPDLPPHDWRRRAWRLIVRLENAARAWELVGWGWFLWDGQYPSLLMRLLKVRAVPKSERVTRLVSYEFMNRQLVWSAFTDFLLFSVPLLPALPTALRPSTLISPLRDLLSQPSRIDYASLPLLPSHPSASDPTTRRGGKGKQRARAVHTGPFASLPKSTCPICKARNQGKVVPIDSTGAASGIALPPIPLSSSSASRGGTQVGMAGGYEHGDEAEADEEDESIDDEERIFVPAQTDCWGGCRWCYYCIGQELSRHYEEIAKEVKSKGSSRVAASGDRAEGHGKAMGKGKAKVNRAERSGAGAEKRDEREEVEEAKPRGWECLRCGGEARRAWRVGAEEEEQS